LSKFGIAALAVVVALIASVGLRASTPTAHADVDATRAVWCGFIDPIANCDDGVSAADIAAYAAVLGDEDGTLTPDDLDDVQQFGGNQLTDEDVTNLGQILIFAFVDDDGAVLFDAETGVSIVVSNDGLGGEAAPPVDANPETCDGADDLDCGTTTPDNGDGIVVATATEDTADEGDEVTVEVSQEDSDPEVQTLNIVGTAFEVTVAPVETTIQSDASADCAGEDGDPAVDDDDALSNPDSTVAVARVLDNDERDLTRIETDFDTGDTDIAEIGDTTDVPGLGTVSIDAGETAGIGAFAVVCGGDTTGDTTVTADIGTDDDSADITVVGEPANVTLAASPAQIACDGTQTSTVTATVTDSDGNNVANGTGVTFSVVALGTANPINTTTTDGTASSTITPLSGATAGVTVIVSSGDASASIRVDCSLPIPTTVPVGTATPPGGVTPPDTGTGGYLGQDSSAGFPLWTLVALALGSFALVAGGLVTRRAGR
jgi:hypothetical protein